MSTVSVTQPLTSHSSQAKEQNFVYLGAESSLTTATSDIKRHSEPNRDPLCRCASTGTRRLRWHSKLRGGARGGSLSVCARWGAGSSNLPGDRRRTNRERGAHQAPQQESLMPSLSSFLFHFTSHDSLRAGKGHACHLCWCRRASALIPKQKGRRHVGSETHRRSCVIDCLI